MTSPSIADRIVHNFPGSAGSDIKNRGASTMSRRQANATLLAGMALAAMPGLALPAHETITLPAPRRTGGMPLMQALQQRRSTREFAQRPLPSQVVSDLLWAAYGINRPSGDRTAPYWRHIMVIDVYAAMADGVWLYDPKQHALLPRLAQDIRAQTGQQDFAATAPLDLVYVAHGERMQDISAEDRRLYASVDTGFIGQNVYLFCASEDLATVFRGAIDYPRLAAAMQLDGSAFVTFAQSVGYPRS
jgi:nitroreductase